MALRPNNQQSSDPVGLDAEEFSNLERNVFLISRHIGLLRQHESDFEKEGILIHKSLEYWINAAQDIQTIFSNRDARRGLQGDIAFGHLTICVAFKANGASLHLRPENTQAALNYHAAQMVAGGITFQICKNCGTSFFGGGAGHGKIKKRAGARFCSDKCRWTQTSGNHRDAGSIVDTVWKQRGPGNTEASVRSMKAADALIVRSAPPVEPPDH